MVSSYHSHCIQGNRLLRWSESWWNETEVIGEGEKSGNFVQCITERRDWLFWYGWMMTFTFFIISALYNWFCLQSIVFSPFVSQFFYQFPDGEWCMIYLWFGISHFMLSRGSVTRTMNGVLVFWLCALNIPSEEWYVLGGVTSFVSLISGITVWCCMTRMVCIWHFSFQLSLVFVCSLYNNNNYDNEILVWSLIRVIWDYVFIVWR